MVADCKQAKVFVGMHHFVRTYKLRCYKENQLYAHETTPTTNEYTRTCKTNPLKTIKMKFDINIGPNLLSAYKSVNCMP
jgi:hypothetical protein